jgi:hypothetical protein
MDQIPSDFRRVGEQFGAAHRRIREGLIAGHPRPVRRAEESPPHR